MPIDAISVRGAREHNLKNIDVVIPRDQLVIITGPSGSGKSSLAFDTIYAEGQRRYVESLSAYARQFLGQMEKPDVDYIEGLSPAISIDQKSGSRNPRSTVATVTEIYDYLRLLFARVGHPHCPNCGREVASQSVQTMVDTILNMPGGTRFMVMAPLVKDRKGENLAMLEDLRKAGYVRVRVDGKIRELSENIALNRNTRHTVEVVVDRLSIPTRDEIAEAVAEGTSSPTDALRSRVTDSVETSLKLGNGVVLVSVIDGDELLFSEEFSCVYCGISFGEIAPRSFSFNSPHGACPDCTGLGIKLEVDPELVIPNKDLTLAEGAIQPWQRAGAMSPWYSSMIASVAKRHEFSINTAVKNLKQESIDVLLYGDHSGSLRVEHQNRHGHTHAWNTSFEGVVSNLMRRYKETESEFSRSEIERYMSAHPCPTCKGRRLKPEALSVGVAGLSIADVAEMSIEAGTHWVDELADENESPLTQRETTISHQILKELKGRLGFLMDVGLNYITLDRAAATLSGGESQRIRLATQIGSGLMGVLYVCDEPSIGLHPIDNQRLIDTLKRLRDLGNTMLIVEHDEAMIRAGDYVIDMGPGAGEHGGEVVAAGTLEDVMAERRSLTGQYLSGAKEIEVPKIRRAGNGKKLVVRGARENNLKNLDIEIPLGVLVCITGVSGSGKSSLIYDILYKKLAQLFYRAREKPGLHDRIDGIEHIDKVISIDQSPIGRTPRSNPATYTGAFGPIRDLFASIPEARMRGYAAGRFSFNVKGGRCETCHGEGYVEIEMHFLPNIEVPCEVCKGQRYNREALEIQFKGKNIAEVLDMTIEESVDFFSSFTAVRSKVETLNSVGLSYMRLGQPATTLSGGEAQRVKLATELSKRATGRTLYILDEPTTGLAFDDVAALLRVLQRLVDAGNTVVLIEHHLDLIKSADWLIDLGPAGGNGGGQLIAKGTPEDVAKVKKSFTGQYLKDLLSKRVKVAAAS